MDDKELTSPPTTTSPVDKHEPQRPGDDIPPSHKNRTLIVCFDGTGDEFDSDVSRII